VKKKILLIGAGGHCASILDSIISNCIFEEVGIVANEELAIPLQAKLLGTDADLKSLKHNGFDFAFIAVGSIGNVSIRKELYAKVKKIGFELPNIIDPSAVVAKDAVFGEGIYLGKNSVIGARCTIGDCAIVNTAAVVEHDCVVGRFVHLSTSSSLCGGVKIGDCTHIGASSVVREGVSIGKNSMIGMGSVVLGNFGDGITAFGNPCKELIK
jgi:sugar O-acyltransferase (sialic acid O-acetyltransferase NeuD family)